MKSKPSHAAQTCVHQYMICFNPSYSAHIRNLLIQEEENLKRRLLKLGSLSILMALKTSTLLLVFMSAEYLLDAMKIAEAIYLSSKLLVSGA